MPHKQTLIIKQKQPPKRPLLRSCADGAYAALLRLATPIKPSIPDPNNQTAAGTGTTAGEAVVVVVGYAVGIL